MVKAGGRGHRVGDPLLLLHGDTPLLGTQSVGPEDPSTHPQQESSPQGPHGPSLLPGQCLCGSMPTFSTGGHPWPLSQHGSLSCPCPQVYSATNVELVTRTRTEHLSDQDKSKSKGKLRCACLQPTHALGWGQHVWDKLGLGETSCFHLPCLGAEGVGGTGHRNTHPPKMLTSVPFSLGGKTPFQSFLGIAQQHSSHNGVSQDWGVAGNTPRQILARR